VECIPHVDRASHEQGAKAKFGHANWAGSDEQGSVWVGSEANLARPDEDQPAVKSPGVDGRKPTSNNDIAWGPRRFGIVELDLAPLLAVQLYQPAREIPDSVPTARLVLPRWPRRKQLGNLIHRPGLGEALETLQGTLSQPRGGLPQNELKPPGDLTILGCFQGLADSGDRILPLEQLTGSLITFLELLTAQKANQFLDRFSGWLGASIG